MTQSALKLPPSVYILGVTLAVLIATCLTFATTTASILEVWRFSDTYSHGIAVLPMAAWAMWRIRDQLDNVRVQPALLGVVFLVGAMLSLWFTRVIGVQFLEQLSLYLVWVSLLWTMLGRHVVQVAFFPIAFCFFAIPFGEFLVPPLMDITADLTVKMVDLNGIPVFRTERFFTLPSGSFEVVEACSGIRFLIVTIVLAVWLAEPLDISVYAKALFVLFAAAVMIVANVVRAYLIVLIVHFTEGEYGAGFDHIVYGWVAFFVAFVLIVLVSNRYRRKRRDGNTTADEGTGIVLFSPAVSLLALLVFIVLPGVLFRPPALGTWSPQAIAFPTLDSEWRGPLAADQSFDLALTGFRSSRVARYASDTYDIHVIYTVYDGLDPDVEMVGWDNRGIDATWRLVSRETVTLESIGELPIETVSRDDERLIWTRWYSIGVDSTASPVAAKLRTAWRRLRGGRRQDSMVLILFDPAMSGREVSDFLTEQAQRFDECVVSADRSDCVLSGHSQ
ncbi:MAG: exosortase A [Pseudomonadota bacterium]